MTREEAIKIIETGKKFAYDEKYNEAFDMAIKALEQEPRKGHWIVKDGTEEGYDIGGVKTWYIQIMCNKCGFIKTAIEGHTGQYHFCPNCGADMRGEQE